MTYEQLVALYRSTLEAPILSAYLPGRSPDPALRAAARTRFDAEVSRIAKTLRPVAREEGAVFERAVAAVREAMASAPALGPQEGWAVFADGGGVREQAALSSPTPFQVEWRHGIGVAPALRSLKQARPAIAVLLDSRSARIGSYEGGQLRRDESFEAEVRAEEASHMGTAPAPTFHHGTHGRPAADELSRRESAAFDRMLAQVLARVDVLVGADGWLVVAGHARGVRELVAALPRGLVSRTEEVPGLTAKATDAELREAIAAAVSTLTRRRDGDLVAQLLDRAAEGGLARTHWDATVAALRAHAVHELLLSSTMIETDAFRAEEAARLAMDGGSRIEVAAGEAAARLDTLCGGIAAALRFPPAELPGGSPAAVGAP
jgi:peptide subunit release factor 1 (eRF1)